MSEKKSSKETVIKILNNAAAEGTSDVFFVKGMPMSFKIDGVIKERDKVLTDEDAELLVRGLYELADNRDFQILIDNWDDDFAFSIGAGLRFRVNTFRQRGAYCAILRVLMTNIPAPQDINIPKKIIGYTGLRNGLVLFTGETGSGKSTSQACLIDHINKHQNKHIVTLEDPIEYTHYNKQCLITQREINSDSKSFATALKASLRQCPDVILVGEMRDPETIETAMTAAETGHLVISTLHTMDAANAVGRIIDAFPKDQAQYIATLLSSVLKCVVFQQLIPKKGGGLVPLFEIMDVNDEVRGLIQEANPKYIRNYIDQNQDARVTTIDYMLIRLYVEGKIEEKTVYAYCRKKNWIDMQFNMIRNGIIPDYLKVPV